MLAVRFTSARAGILVIFRRMQRVREQQETGALDSIGGEHGRHTPSHGSPADDKHTGLEPLPRIGHDGRVALLEQWHRIGAAAAFFRIEKIESHHAETAPNELAAGRCDGSVLHVAARTVTADEDGPHNAVVGLIERH